jgi:replicative DNA helicase
VADHATIRKLIDVLSPEQISEFLSEADVPSTFDLGLTIGTEFVAQEDEEDWIIKDVMMANEPAANGGPSKTAKTLISTDQFISISTGTPFLSRFPVPRARTVALISGESGRRAIKEHALNVCRSRGLSAKDLGNIYFGLRVPQFTNQEHMAVLRRAIEDNGIEVIGIDPFYLALGLGVDPNNMFEMGRALQGVTDTCLEAGATPVIVHHFTKFRPNPYAPPVHTEFSHAGMSQFMRQWIMVAPRERYDAEHGIFKLHFCFGGSAGQSGEYALDIEVGKKGDGGERKWDVKIFTPGEVIADKQEQEALEKAEKKVAKAAEKVATERQQVKKALTVFRQNGGKATGSKLRAALECSGATASRILHLLEHEGRIRKAEKGWGYEIVVAA